MTTDTFYFVESLQHEMEVANRIFNHLVEHDLFRDELEKLGKKGGYALRTDLEGAPILGFQLGTVAQDKRSRYPRIAAEKCARLSMHSDHVASAQSRDPSKDRWGGGIRCMTCLRSLSGLTEELDELFSVLWAMELGDLDIETAKAILKDNTAFHKYRMAPHGLMK